MAHPADNVDWAILSVLQGEGPRTLQQMSWHLNLLDKLDLMLGLRRLLNEGKIVRDGDLYAVPAQRAVRNSSRARKNGYKEVVGLKDFVVVDYRGKFYAIFRVGDRVRMLPRANGFPPVATGTVIDVHTSSHGMIRVESDDGYREWMFPPYLEHVSPLEELAALGRAKTNPKMVTDPDDPGYEIGEYTRLKHNGKVAKVLRKKPWSVYTVGFEDDERGRRAVEVGFENMEKLTPLEQLAIVGKESMKNPRPRQVPSGFGMEDLKIGSRVARRQGEKVRVGTITGMSVGRPVRVRWDDDDIERGEFRDTLHYLSPLEELALLGKELQTKKNPDCKYAEYAEGDQVRIHFNRGGGDGNRRVG